MLNILINCFHLPKLSEGAGGAGVFISSILPELGKEANVRVFVSSNNKEDYSFKTTTSICLDAFDDTKLDNWWDWADVYYDPQNGLSPKNVPLSLPTVCHIYDLQHEIYPHFFSKAMYEARNEAYGWAIRRADAVFTISEWEKKNILSFVPNSNPIVIYLASFLYERIHRESKDLLTTSFTKKDYFVFPAVRWIHKNHYRIIEAMTFFNNKRKYEGKQPIKLIFTGSTHALSNDKTLDLIKVLGDTENFEVAGYISDEDLAMLYLKGKGMLFPSIYEGYGIPIIDAMNFKIPVLASPEACIPEVAGKNISYFSNVFNAYSMAKDIDDFTTIIEADSYDIETTYNDAQKYSVKRIVKDMINGFENVIADKVNENKNSKLKLNLPISQDLKRLTVIIDVPYSSIDIEKVHLNLSNSIIEQYNIIWLEETDYLSSKESDSRDYFVAFYKKNSIESKKIALENILLSMINTECTLMINVSDINILETAKINLALTILDIRKDITAIRLLTDLSKNPSGEIKTYLPEELNSKTLENLEFMTKSENLLFLMNFLYKTWILRNGGMLGSQKRVSHFVREKHLII